MKRSAWIVCILAIFVGCEFEGRVPIEMASINQTQPIGREKALESTVLFDIGSLEITGGSEGTPLYSLDLEYDKASYAPEIRYGSNPSGERGQLYCRLQSTHKSGIRKTRQNNRLRLVFNDSIPLDLKVNTGVGDARLSLSGMKLARIAFESGVGGAKLSAYEPNSISCEYMRIKNGVGSIEAVGLGNLNFRDFEFEGGVGGADLDFTGEWRQNADIRILVGVGGVNLRMPREVGVRVEAEKNFLSGVHLEGFSLRDSYHYSANYDSAKIRVAIRVTTGIGGMKITWV
jgi:hypothetical protein